MPNLLCRQPKNEQRQSTSRTSKKCGTNPFFFSPQNKSIIITCHAIQLLNIHSSILMMKSWPYTLLQLIQFTKKQFGMSNIEARLSYIAMQHEDKIDIFIFQHITLCTDRTLTPYEIWSSQVVPMKMRALRSPILSGNTTLMTQLNIPAGSNLLHWEC